MGSNCCIPQPLSCRALTNAQANCQTFDAADGEEGLEGCDNDKMLFDVITDLLASLAKACGPDFSDIFQKQLQKPLCRQSTFALIAFPSFASLKSHST